MCQMRWRSICINILPVLKRLANGLIQESVLLQPLADYHIHPHITHTSPTHHPHITHTSPTLPWPSECTYPLMILGLMHFSHFSH